MRKTVYLTVLLSLATTGCFISRHTKEVREVPSSTVIEERHSAVPAPDVGVVHRETTVESAY